jgi:hypothetical protein
MGETDGVRRAPCVVLVFGRAASPVSARGLVLWIIPEVEGDAHHLAPGIVQARGRDRRVDSTAHRDEYALPGRWREAGRGHEQAPQRALRTQPSPRAVEAEGKDSS